jgi:hypothetical protein
VDQGTPRHEITKKRVLYERPGMEALTVQRDIDYRSTASGVLTMDLYRPPAAGKARLPVVVLVSGYSDVGARARIGCAFKETESCISWARLAAASGLAAVAYETGREPATDARALLDHIRRNAAPLGLDETRIGLWACSGHVPNALSLLMREAESPLRCAALCYGYMLDLEGSTAVAEAARTFGFVTPAAGRSVADLRPDVSLLVLRAGRDEMPRLNEALDRFVPAALQANLPIELVNLAAAPHAFEIFQEGEGTREAVRRVLDFLRFNLRAGV